jgi:hypothetical protein
MATDQERAHQAVAATVLSGVLPAAATRPCADCGDAAASYHHHSYAPEHQLDVTPLCWPCHGRRHRGAPRPWLKRRPLPEARYPLRVDQDTYAAIQEIAAAEQRSVNAQIERFLREAVERWRRQQERRGADHE